MNNRQLYFKTQGIQLFIIACDIISRDIPYLIWSTSPLKSVLKIGEFEIHALANCTSFSSKTITSQLSARVQCLLQKKESVTVCICKVLMLRLNLEIHMYVCCLLEYVSKRRELVYALLSSRQSKTAAMV